MCILNVKMSFLYSTRNTLYVKTSPKVLLDIPHDTIVVYDKEKYVTFLDIIVSSLDYCEIHGDVIFHKDMRYKLNDIHEDIDTRGYENVFIMNIDMLDKHDVIRTITPLLTKNVYANSGKLNYTMLNVIVN